MAPTVAPQRASPAWLRMLQVACTLILSVLLARTVDWRQFGEVLLNLRWEYLGLAALLLLPAHLTNVARWRFLIWPSRLPYVTLLGYYGAGLFANNFLPTGMGGDGVRAALASRHVPAGRALLSVALDRALGLLALGVFVLPGLWLGLPPGLGLPAFGQAWPLWAALGLGGALAVAAGAALLWRLAPRLRGLAGERLRRWFALPADTPRPLWRYWTTRVGGGLLFSIVSVGLIILSTVAILAALDLPPWLSAALWAVVLSSLSLLAPIAVNGLGVAESVYVLVLAGYDVASGPALSVALLARLFIVLYSLIGGLIALRR